MHLSIYSPVAYVFFQSQNIIRNTEKQGTAMPAFLELVSRPRFACLFFTIPPCFDCSVGHLQRAWGTKLCDKIRIRKQGTELYNRHDTLSHIMCITVLIDICTWDYVEGYLQHEFQTKSFTQMHDSDHGELLLIARVNHLPHDPIINY